MRMSISSSTALENDCHGPFLEKDVKAGTAKANSCGRTEHSYQSLPVLGLLGCFKKSLISPKEAL